MVDDRAYFSVTRPGEELPRELRRLEVPTPRFPKAHREAAVSRQSSEDPAHGRFSSDPRPSSHDVERSNPRDRGGRVQSLQKDNVHGIPPVVDTKVSPPSVRLPAPVNTRSGDVMTTPLPRKIPSADLCRSRPSRRAQTVKAGESFQTVTEVGGPPVNGSLRATRSAPAACPALLPTPAALRLRCSRGVLLSGWSTWPPAYLPGGRRLPGVSRFCL